MSGLRVPFVDLHLSDESEQVRAAIARVIDSAWFVLGPEVEAFEREFAAVSGASYAVGTANGTDAIALVLRALGIGPGDEVITSPLSAAYTALAILMTGARPVFADIDPERMTLDPAAAERAITPRTAALLPVHLYGQPADMPALAGLASRKGLALVEDCCQAHLATSQGQPVGTFGAAGAFSFYPTKNLGALGDGGAVLTQHVSIAERGASSGEPSITTGASGGAASGDAFIPGEFAQADASAEIISVRRMAIGVPGDPVLVNVIDVLAPH